MPALERAGRIYMKGVIVKVFVPSVALMLLVGVGCANKDKPATAGTDLQPNSAVTDVSASPVAYTPPPVSPAPVQTITPDPIAPAPVASTGGSYTVKKGDTLYGIARQKYGDGKQWKKIAAANPGVTASSLKVGQTLVIP